jgi:hypothetical protein
MIIEIIKPHRKWKIGDKVDVTPDLGASLCFMGVAKLHSSQVRFDVQPKADEADEKPPQQVTINNYYIGDDQEFSKPEPEPPKKKKKNFFSIKNK